MKTAFVLSGGSIKGAFQAGAISELLRLGLEPDAIYGVSAGALNGAFLADRAGRQLQKNSTINWREVGASLENFWLTRIQKPSDIVAKRWTAQVAVGALFGRYKGLVKVDRFHNIVRSEISRANLLKFDRSGRRFSPGAVDVWTSKIAYATPASSQIIEYVLASAAIPIAFPVHEVPLSSTRKHPFVDGGVRDVAPLRRAIADGYEKVICVVCQTAELDGIEYDVGKIMLHIDRVTEIITNELVQNDLDIINQFIQLANSVDPNSVKEAGFLAQYRNIPPPRLIRPKDAILVDIMSFTKRDIANMIELGKAAVRGAEI